MAILTSVSSNDTQRFKIAQYSFYCQPYGIVSLEELYHKTITNETCKATIEKFYKKHPLLEYYISERLHLKQLYHVEFKEERCILYIEGQRTLSELLLRNGLGFIEPFFSDKEFYHSFKGAQKNARDERVGMWSEELIINCMASAYQE